MQTLAATVRDLGKVDESVLLQKEVLDEYERVYGPDHPNTTFACYALAFNYDRQGAFDEAFSAARRAYEATRKRHGANHPDTARYLRLLGFVELNRGVLNEAESHLRRALRAYRASFSYGHSDEAGILNRLAFILIRRGAADAAEIYREAAQVHRERGESEPLFVTYAPHLLAWAMKAMGDEEESEALYRESAELYRRLLPPDHPQRVETEAALLAPSP